MEDYCHTCGGKKPMKRIRRPKNDRLLALIFLALMIVSAIWIKSWTLTLLFLVLALIMVFIGKNYWECEVCGELTERV